MKPVFADTSHYLALVNPKDEGHADAVKWSQIVLGRIFLTEYVLVELGCFLSRGSDRRLFRTIVDEIEADSDTIVIPASTSLFRQGLALFNERPDKEWSLVDCISFVVMKQRRLLDALSTDHHFRQAGFRPLLTIRPNHR